MILLVITCIIYPCIIWAEETETTTPLQQISEIIDSYPDISPFQASQLLEEAEKAIQSGISSEDTQEIIQESLEKKMNADSIIDIFSLLNELAEDGLPTSPIINKAKEGFAKGVSPDKIILSLKEKSENLQFAKYLVEEALSEGANIEDKNAAIEILARGLPYNYQEDMITDIFVEGLRNKKGIEEIADAFTATPPSEEEATTPEEPSEEGATIPAETSSEEEVTTPAEPLLEEEVITPEESPSEEGATIIPTQIDGPDAP